MPVGNSLVQVAEAAPGRASVEDDYVLLIGTSSSPSLFIVALKPLETRGSLCSWRNWVCSLLGSLTAPGLHVVPVPFKSQLSALQFYGGT